MSTPSPAKRLGIFERYLSLWVGLCMVVGWLETTGTLVERFDPVAAPCEVARLPEVQQLLAKGDASLPLLLVDDLVVLQGEYPSRARHARVVGSARYRGRRTDRSAA